MTLPDLVTTLGPVAGVALFMWLNRGPQKGDRADDIGGKLSALLDETKKANSAMADLAKSMAILLDRSDR